MYTIKFTGEFKRQMKMCERRGYDMELLREAIRILSTEGKLPERYLPHQYSFPPKAYNQISHNK